MPEWWWAYLALGAFVGFFAGLLGIGGGAAMVPVLAFVYAAKGFATAEVVHLALGTSMATMLFTSVSSVRAHHRHGAVNWPMVKGMAPGIIVGTFGGALLASTLSVRLLAVVFTLLIYYISAQMLFGKKPQAGAVPLSTSGMRLAAGMIGVISSLTATGGAALVVAYLVRRGTRIHDAIGTAAAIGWPLAAAGTAGYVITGWGNAGLPEYASGYVYWPALAGIVIASMLLAPVGARLAHRTPGTVLRKIFATLMFVLATKMLVSFF
ncbi:MAG: sulfite exporter TauE/SafE family protein [Betaproteobacteria bacterium]|nr:MAG: sulfite exporter TauE/SafE family protein [Betaproteobacteria bacterium]